MIVVKSPVFTNAEAASVFDFLVFGNMISLLGASWDKLYDLYFTTIPHGTVDDAAANWIRDQYEGWTNSEIHQWVDLHTVD